MKSFATYIFLAFAASQTISAAATPKMPNSESNIAVRSPEDYNGEWFAIGGTEEGKVFSSISPNQKARRDDVVDWHTYAEKPEGTVYSSIARSVSSEKRDAYTPLGEDEVKDFIKEHFRHTSPAKREEDSLEKRASWAQCGVCMAVCGANQAGIHQLTVSQRVMFCLINCIGQGACSDHFSRRYQDTFHMDFAPAGYQF